MPGPTSSVVEYSRVAVAPCLCSDAAVSSGFLASSPSRILCQRPRDLASQRRGHIFSIGVIRPGSDRIIDGRDDLAGALGLDARTLCDIEELGTAGMAAC